MDWNNGKAGGLSMDNCCVEMLMFYSYWSERVGDIEIAESDDVSLME